MDSQTLLLAAAVLVTALLYSSVGHGGASGYLAVMSLMGVAQTVMRPTALLLNILVAGVASIQYVRRGHFSWRLFFPFAIAAIPCAWLGGRYSLPLAIYKQMLGAALLVAAARMLLPKIDGPTRQPPPAAALLIGGGIGAISGMIGIGGGIFLSPVLLLMHWAPLRQTAAVSAMFILVNSISGLAGNLSAVGGLPSRTWVLAGAAFIGGIAGGHLGSQRLPLQAMRILLALVLIMAGLKLLMT